LDSLFLELDKNLGPDGLYLWNNYVWGVLPNYTLEFLRIQHVQNLSLVCYLLSRSSIVAITGDDIAPQSLSTNYKFLAQLT